MPTGEIYGHSSHTCAMPLAGSFLVCEERSTLASEAAKQWTRSNVGFLKLACEAGVAVGASCAAARPGRSRTSALRSEVLRSEIIVGKRALPMHAPIGLTGPWHLSTSCLTVAAGCGACRQLRAAREGGHLRVKGVRSLAVIDVRHLKGPTDLPAGRSQRNT